MRVSKHLIDRRQYKIYFVWDGVKVLYNLRLLAIGRNPSYPTYLYTRAGDKFDFTYGYARLQRDEPENLKRVKMIPLNPSNRHLLKAFYIKLI